MDEDQGQRMRPRAFLVNAMKRQPSDIGTEVAERIQYRFLTAPVELLLPIRDQLAQIQTIGPLAPASATEISRPSSARKPVFEIDEIGFGGCDLKWFDVHDS